MMISTLKVKLQPTKTQKGKLLKTMETFNAACDDISKETCELRAFNNYKCARVDMW